MTLYFTLVSPDDRANASPCVCCAELEIQLDVLNSFVANGNILLSAYLLDDDGVRMDLPVAAFDGLPIAESLRKLTKAYQQQLRVLS